MNRARLIDTRACLLLVLILPAVGAIPAAGVSPRHVVVFREAGRFGGWPANHGIRAWSDEIVLRNDGGCWDLGYTRTVQRADGRLVTVYYFNESEAGERYIGATIWDPGPSVRPGERP